MVARSRAPGLETILGLGGQGVLVGAEVSPDLWMSAFAGVGFGPHILQERVVPRQEADGLAAVYGFFMMEEGLVGLDARVAATARGQVINFSSRPDTATAAVQVGVL